MLIYMNLVRDFEGMLSHQLAELGFRRPEKLVASQAFALLFDNSQRTVPTMRYRVEISKELAAKALPPDTSNVLQEVIARLAEGKCVRPYLSKSSAIISRLDGLQLHWGINHLHLVPYGPLTKAGFIEDRSDLLLFFRIYDGVAYLIDVLPHPEHGKLVGWARSDLVRITDRNWPHLHQLLVGASMTQEVSDEDYAALRTKNVCACISTDRGIVMAAGGVSTAGHSIESTMVLDRTLERLEALQALILDRYEEIFPHIQSFVTSFSLLAITDDGFVVRENSSGQTKLVPNRYILG